LALVNVTVTELFLESITVAVALRVDESNFAKEGMTDMDMTSP